MTDLAGAGPAQHLFSRLLARDFSQPSRVQADVGALFLDADGEGLVTFDLERLTHAEGHEILGAREPGLPLAAGQDHPLAGRRPAAALLSDRWGRRRTLLAAGALLVVFSYPLIALLSLGGFLLVTVVLTVLLAMFSLNDGVFPAFFTESFSTRTRYTGFALTFNVGAVLFGGISPYVATWLIERTGNPVAPASYLIGIALLSVIATMVVKETSGKPLPGATGAR